MPNAPKRPPEGWARPGNARKYHYYRAGRSICGKWALLYRPALETGNNNSPDNCKACKAKLAAELRKENP